MKNLGVPAVAQLIQVEQPMLSESDGHDKFMHCILLIDEIRASLI